VRILLLRHLDTISCALYAKWLQKWPHSISHSKFESFTRSVGSHLASAYNLARWLTLDENSAKEIVEGAYVRAWQLFDNKKHGSSKAWFLAIVRNMSHNLHSQGDRRNPLDGQQPISAQGNATDLRQSIERLPLDFREVLVMRELEQMSYGEIADATGLPVGTVIARLSMARKGVESAMYVNYRGTPVV